MYYIPHPVYLVWCGKKQVAFIDKSKFTRHANETRPYYRNIRNVILKNNKQGSSEWNFTSFPMIVYI